MRSRFCCRCARAGVRLPLPPRRRTRRDRSSSELTFERVFASPSLSGPAPRAAKLSPDGRFLTLLRNRADDSERYDLWAYDRHDGEWRMLVDSEKLGSGRELSEAEKMQRERQRIGGLKGIVAYDWAADGKAVLVPLDGELYLARLDGTVTRLTGWRGRRTQPGAEQAGQVSSRSCATGGCGSAHGRRRGAGGHAARRARRSTGARPSSSRRRKWTRDGGLLVVARRQRGSRSSASTRRRSGVVTRAAIGASGTSVFEQRYPAAGSPMRVSRCS